MNKTEHLLVVLSEECSEVIKEVSKALRFGLEDCNPNINDGVTNSEKITKEIADLIGIIETLVSGGIIKGPSLKDVEEKRKRIAHYLKYSNVSEITDAAKKLICNRIEWEKINYTKGI